MVALPPERSLLSLPPARGRAREGGTAKRFLFTGGVERLRRLPPIPTFPLEGGRKMFCDPVEI